MMSSTEEVYLWLRERAPLDRITTNDAQKGLPQWSQGAISGAFFRLKGLGLLECMRKEGRVHIFRTTPALLSDPSPNFKKGGAPGGKVGRRIHHEPSTLPPEARLSANALADLIATKKDALLGLLADIERLEALLRSSPEVLLSNVPEDAIWKELQRRRGRKEEA